METFLSFVLTAIAVFAGMHMSYWAATWELRFIVWYKRPRCAVCKEKCSHISVVPDAASADGFKSTPLCDLHLRESIEFHRKDSESRAAAEDREGEEWKSGGSIDE